MQMFNVKGMTCAHYERAVIQAIQSRDPDARVEVDVNAGQVRVDGRLDVAANREAIEEEGYQV